MTTTRYRIQTVQQVVRRMELPPGYNQEALRQLADYADQLEAQVRAVASVCQSADGDYLDGESEIPVGEVLRMLVETGADLDSLRIIQPRASNAPRASLHRGDHDAVTAHPTQGRTT